jgi:hypothetical protein
MVGMGRERMCKACRFLQKYYFAQSEGLRLLKAVLLVGEHSEPTLVSAYLELLNRCGVPVMSSTNSGPKEVGSPITAQMLTLVAHHVQSGQILWLGLAVLNSQGANNRDTSPYHRGKPTIRQSVVDGAQHGPLESTQQAVGKACKTAGRNSAPVNAFYSKLI